MRRTIVPITDKADRRAARVEASKRRHPSNALDDKRDGIFRMLGYGPYLWEVCDSCNYNQHICPMCGDDLTHAEAQGVNQQHPCLVDDD